MCMAMHGTITFEILVIVHNVHIKHKYMKLTINEELLRYLMEGSGQRFTRCEAFAYLYSVIKNSDDGVFKTSCNRLAQAWRWENHLVRGFIDELIRLNVIFEQRQATYITLELTEDFKQNIAGFNSLLSLLSLKVKKAGKTEAFLHVLKKLMELTTNEPVKTSCRALASEFGWSHHTVYSFLDIMERNGIISKIPSADGNTFELRRAFNIQ